MNDAPLHDLAMPIRAKRQPGVTIIVPSIRGEVSLLRALESVAGQTVDKKLIQVIVIENGPGSTAARAVRKMRSNPSSDKIDWLWFRSEGPGAARARNVGLAASNRQFITFLDDDDWIEPGYLSQLMEVADSSTISMTGILEHGDSARGENTLNARVQALPKRRTELSSVPWALGFVASKLIPWELVQGIEFPEGLKSGEDVVFFAQLLSHASVFVQPVNECNNASYCRSVGSASVSRGRSNFQFAVSERLEVIRCLSQIETPNSGNQVARNSLIKSQVGFIRSYFEQSDLVEQDRVLDEIASFGIEDFPWREFDRGQPDRLIFAYCFPPDADASANVMAKRIMTRGDLVDVISNDMAAVRAKDPVLYAVVSRWINRHVVVDTPTSFANWEAISSWARRAVKAAESSKRGYTEVYSRALWVASHVAGCLYKLKHPETKWVAEFSDPLALGADGVLRPGPMGEDRAARKLLGVIPPNENGVSRTLFQVVEEATLLLADEIVFTNDAQMDVILENYREEFRAKVARKSAVASQPVPPQFLYEIGAARRSPVHEISIAYFGAFYPQRGVGTVLEALRGLPDGLQRKIKLSIFTNSAVDDYVLEVATVQPQIEYLDFLAETRQADVLLVTDTSTRGVFRKNPFLPSKYADYLGSGTRIWGIVEPGSPLSTKRLDYVSVDSTESIAATLVEITRDSLSAE